MNKQNEKRVLQQELLAENSIHLELVSKQLQASFSRCNEIKLLQEGLGFEELERFEALTSRFARLADLILQKSIRLIELIELESSGSILDRINKAEKKGLISDSQKYIEIRQLRNSIAHEYDSEALMKIFEDCLTFTPDLLASVESISDYIKLNNLL
ncbi:HepT-like ribonuclease domain-containing protein [Psychromonas hadalis]|uniref:HepT-like ribonuclease domain-containing protein n=1 Tax=Psychromonas hadalis TaxID=211669 RepID=UPI0003B5D3BE|nr:nucleotidyltransferase substrate binding protein [Psychromonas hadalis]